MSFFPSIFVPLPFYFCIESISYIFLFRMVFFYLVTTGWLFDLNLCENSINQSINNVYRVDIFLSSRPRTGCVYTTGYGRGSIRLIM